MRMYDIIEKKREGNALTAEEIRFFVGEYCNGRIPDAQAAALLMAICCNGMDADETTELTRVMEHSGDVLDLSAVSGPTVDKHSTGGVGDKTTLVVAPTAAALGCKVAKMSGRALGHTGGTLDKLESIPGFVADLPEDLFLSQVNSIGLAITGQTGHLTPADKKIYALRDETATVMSKPLIASSIMSKKLASGSSNIVLDVKYGSGAFMKTLEDARELAQIMVDIGKRAGRNMTAVISNMDRPLGYNVGNSLEVIEAIQVLKGEGPEDLYELSTTLAGLMYSSCFTIPYDDAKAAAEEAIRSGAALEKFRELVRAQRGDVSLIDHPECFETSRYTQVIRASREGYLTAMNTGAIGTASCILGAGRENKDAYINYTAGIQICKKTGDSVSVGETIAVLRTDKESSLHDAEKTYLSAITIGPDKPEPTPLIHAVLH
ncbi:MAG: thymidine phosphorylase [Clostridia bacterium]|nr:thymidine phosphorylase [Clostridia bacterium]